MSREGTPKVSEGSDRDFGKFQGHGGPRTASCANFEANEGPRKVFALISKSAKVPERSLALNFEASEGPRRVRACPGRRGCLLEGTKKKDQRTVACTEVSPGGV